MTNKEQQDLYEWNSNKYTDILELTEALERAIKKSGNDNKIKMIGIKLQNALDILK